MYVVDLHVGRNKHSFTLKAHVYDTYSAVYTLYVSIYKYSVLACASCVLFL